MSCLSLTRDATRDTGVTVRALETASVSLGVSRSGRGRLHTVRYRDTAADTATARRAQLGVMMLHSYFPLKKLATWRSNRSMPLFMGGMRARSSA